MALPNFNDDNWDEQMHAEDLERLREARYYILGTVNADGWIKVTSLMPGAAPMASVVTLAGAVKAEAEHEARETRAVCSECGDA
jgi:hypothetical protein